MGKDKVFVDSSILVTAVLSPLGGSFYIINNWRSRFEFQINEYIFEETMRVLENKFSPRAHALKNTLLLIIGLASIKILKNPPPTRVRTLEKFISKEDAPILASAIAFCSYLLTLDNDFFTDAVLRLSKKKGLIITKPKEFILSHRLQ